MVWNLLGWLGCSSQLRELEDEIMEGRADLSVDIYIPEYPRVYIHEYLDTYIVVVHTTRHSPFIDLAFKFSTISVYRLRGGGGNHGCELARSWTQPQPQIRLHVFEPTPPRREERTWSRDDYGEDLGWSLLESGSSWVEAVPHRTITCKVLSNQSSTHGQLERRPWQKSHCSSGLETLSTSGTWLSVCPHRRTRILSVDNTKFRKDWPHTQSKIVTTATMYISSNMRVD